MKNKLLQINAVANSGSTGRITEKIGIKVLDEGWESYIAYGRWGYPSKSHLIKIGSQLEVLIHGIRSRITDKHGYYSCSATRKLIKEIIKINPDIIHLHNIHGYYLNFKILFDFLAQYNKPIVWTLHDCWSYTGHCAHYTAVGCNKWQNQCYRCPNIKSYPKSYIDNSEKNYIEKKNYFNKVHNMQIVTVSEWLHQQVQKSFLKNYPITTIYNGINTEIYKPTPSSIRNQYNINTRFMILSVASYWNQQKGLYDFYELSEMLPEDCVIVLVGVNKQQIKNLPHNIIGIPKTESVSELVELYSTADVYISFSIEETFGMTIAESMACGTPTIVYNSTACPELIGENTGFIINPKDFNKVMELIKKIRLTGKDSYIQPCRKHIIQNFSENKTYNQYISLYKHLLEQ